MRCECASCGGEITGLAHIGVMVRDIEASLRFYVEALGFEVTDRADMGEVKLAFLNIGSCLLELVQTPDASPREAGPVDHIAMEVKDIDALMCRLTDRGVKFASESASHSPSLLGGVKNVFFAGPDGEKLEFFEYVGG